MLKRTATTFRGPGMWKLYNKINTKRIRELEIWKEKQVDPTGQLKETMPTPRSKAFGWDPELQTHANERWPREDESKYPVFSKAEIQPGIKVFRASKPKHYT
mmetsp:Transcript_8375/g.16180  ORF Transcript_8375/g.16180 Transcript_8375/m.16180 type:complete len:102 (+) Transcript_8375:61-366(+)